MSEAERLVLLLHEALSSNSAICGKSGWFATVVEPEFFKRLAREGQRLQGKALGAPETAVTALAE